MSTDIAVIGMSCRYPGAGSVAELWNNLKLGKDTISDFSDEELIKANIDLELIDNPSYVKRRGIIQDIDLFDAEFFGISPHEASIMDPQQRVFLEICREALESAGYMVNNDEILVGVFAGMADNTYLNNCLLKNKDFIQNNQPYQTAFLNSLHFLSTRVSYLLNLKGPSVNIATACSTSLVAIIQACEALQMRTCDIALAGGVAIRVPQISGYLYQSGSIYSRDGICRAFDENASGTVPSNGAGVVVLKRLDEAIRDGDNVEAVIKSYAINNDGANKAGYAAPSVVEQTRCIATSLSNIGNVEKVAYVEAHGTGTVLGDPIEVTALTKAFGFYTQKKHFCGLGSIKTNIGHTDVAAGVAGVIKSILILKNREIPAALHFSTPNSRINFTDSPFYVNDKPSALTQDSFCIGVSSFGIGGTNAHMILGEAPQQIIETSARGSNVLLLSAKNHEALIKQKEGLLSDLKCLNYPDNSLADLSEVAYTSQLYRSNFNSRMAFVYSDKKHALRLLELQSDFSIFTNSDRALNNRDIVFVFQGEKALYAGCVRDIYHSNLDFNEYFDQCCEYLSEQTKQSKQMKQIVLGYALDINYVNNVDDGLDSIARQLTAFIIEYCLAKTYLKYGVKPSALLGKEAGEYTAACVDNTISVEDTIKLIQSQQLNTRNSIPFSETLNALMEKGYGFFVEIGIGSSLQLLIKEHVNDSVIISSLPDRDEYYRRDLNQNIYFERVLGALWVNGVDILWQQLYSHGKRRRTLLPRYIFNKKPCWIAPSDEVFATSSAFSALNAFIYEPYLELSSQTLSQLPYKIEQAEQAEIYLVFADDYSVANKLVAQLNIAIASQDKIIVCTKGKIDKKYEGEFEEISANHYRFSPCSKNAYKALVDVLIKKSLYPKHILHFWSLSDVCQKSFDDGIFSLINFFQASINADQDKQLLKSGRRLTVFTNHIKAITLEEKTCPEKAAMLGLCLVLSQETPVLAKIVDIVDTDIIDMPDSIANILNEIYTHPREAFVAYRKGMRFIVRYRPYEDTYFNSSVSSNYLRKNGVYVITGGFGKIGLELIEFLGNNYNANLVLIVKNNIFDECVPSSLSMLSIKNKNILDRINKIKGSLSSLLIIQADVTDDEQMQRAFVTIKNNFAMIDGVFHLAAVINFSTRTLIKDMCVEQVYEQLEPKIHGIRNLVKLTSILPTRFCVAFSSISALIGGSGLCAYAASNCVLDNFIETMKTERTDKTDQKTHWIGINWDAWGEKSGDRPEGIRSVLSTHKALQLLKSILDNPRGMQFAVTSTDINKLIFDWVNYSNLEKNNLLQEVDKNCIGGICDLKMNIKNIFEECLGLDNIVLDDDFYDIGGDSISLLQLLDMLNQKFSEKILLVDLLRNRTVNKLYDFLFGSMVNVKALDIPFLVKIKETGEKQPIFLMPPVSGTVICYFELAKYSCANHQLLAFQDPMLDLDNVSFSTINEMASYYLQTILSIQKTGTYLIGGYSFGANVAFEIVRQLEKLGKKALLIIIDGWAKCSKEMCDRDSDYNHQVMERIFNETKSKMANFVYNKDRYLDLMWKRMELLSKYHPSSIESKITLFKASKILPEYLNIDDKTNHWQMFTSKPIELITINSDHMTILDRLGSMQVAKELEEYLNAEY